MKIDPFLNPIELQVLEEGSELYLWRFQLSDVDRFHRYNSMCQCELA
jgi:hypothetical protein